MTANKLDKTRISYGFYIVSMLIFGTNGILASHISLNSSQIVLLRTLLGGLLLTILLFLSGGFDKDKVRKDRTFLILGGLALGLNWVFLFAAYQMLNVSLATLIYYLGPMLVLVLSPILFKEKLSSYKVFSALMVGLGLVLISGSILFGDMDSMGLVFAILSAIFYGLVIIFNKKIKETGGLETAALELDIAFILLVIIVGLKGEFPQMHKSEFIYIGCIGFINTGLAYFLYFSSVKKLNGQSLALLSYIDPVSALIFSAIFLGETLTNLQVFGSVLIIGGAIYGELREEKR